jgi:hypothetical protein
MLPQLVTPFGAIFACYALISRETQGSEREQPIYDTSFDAGRTNFE